MESRPSPGGISFPPLARQAGTEANDQVPEEGNGSRHQRCLSGLDLPRNNRSLNLSRHFQLPFPGDRLVGYSIVCDTSPYLPNPRMDKRRRYSMLHSQESGSSVFFQSQEETGPSDNWGSAKDPESGFPSEKAPGLLEISGDLGSESDTDQGLDPTASSRRRAYSANQIADREPSRRVPTASDPSSALAKNPLRKAHLQDLTQLSPELQPWPLAFQSPQPFAASPPISATRIRGSGARTALLAPAGTPPFPPKPGRPTAPPSPPARREERHLHRLPRGFGLLGGQEPQQRRTASGARRKRGWSPQTP
ncbi:hypothetical protein JRQ81_009916 [Phrynocephalus forsythii]|uniref:Uncharacterized protein n=1 Tax=Phrynocephalus forsythii TaxID=171643 RepID=A0A9Q0X9Z8_9SAUR|nr:hypothetical protein JRQ81_009916 [Phrynocephalus forsythii]